MALTRSINFPNTRDELETIFIKLQRAVMNQCLNSGTFGIDTAKDDVENDTAVYYMVDGQMYVLDAGTAFVLSGTVTADKFNVFVFTADADGDEHTYMGTEGATLGAVVLPDIPEGEVALGMVVINPTGTGNFVGGTTELDDATVVPNAVFINLVGAVLPQLREL